MSRAVNKAKKAHDKLVLVFLKKFEAEGYVETEETANEFEKLNRERLNYVRKNKLIVKGHKADPKNFFTETITNILKKVKENESKRLQVIAEDQKINPINDKAHSTQEPRVLSEPLVLAEPHNERMVVTSPPEGRHEISIPR